MKLILAISHDGYVCRGDEDKMDWTGQSDKQVFKLLTGVGGVIGVGSKTYGLMPKTLQGRNLVKISEHSGGLRLGQFARQHPDGWLGGGQTLAMAALQIDLIDEVHLVRNPAELGYGTRDMVTPFLEQHLGWSQAMSTRLNWGALTVEVWRRGR